MHSQQSRAFDDVMLSIAHNTSQTTEFRYFILQSLWCFHTHSKQTDAQRGNSNRVVATWSLILTELTDLSISILVLDNG